MLLWHLVSLTCAAYFIEKFSPAFCTIFILSFRWPWSFFTSRTKFGKNINCTKSETSYSINCWSQDQQWREQWPEVYFFWTGIWNHI